MYNEINLTDPKPLYEQIENDIKEKISSNQLMVGDKIGSHHELAKAYNVSLITVKKALSNLIAQGVLFSRIGKGTYVANQQQQVTFTDHKSIGLVLKNVKHPFYAPIIQSIEERAYQQGFNVLLSSSLGDIKKEEAQIDHFQKIGVNGLIIASLSLIYRATASIRYLHENNFPYTMISYMHDPEIWYVGIDHEHGGFLGGEHLAKMDYEKIGYIHGGENNLLGEVRKNGFCRALNEYGKEYSKQRVYYLDESFDRYKAGYELGKKFPTIKDRPEAVFAYTDSAALGFMEAIIEEGMKVPDDVAIVGFNDIDVAKYAPVPLTTVRQPAKDIGELAADILIKRINNQDHGNRTVLKSTLVVRESCGIKIHA